jgi:hypothetical protein
MILRLLILAILLIVRIGPAQAAVTFSGSDITFEAGAGELHLGQSYAGTLLFPDGGPSSVQLHLLLTTSIFFCVEGECDGDPNAGQEFLPVSFSKVGNQLWFEFTVPEECFSGECDKFIPGVYQYDFDLAVLLFTDPIVLIGDFSDVAAFEGSITPAIGTTVPEASTWAMMLIGFLGIGIGCRRGRSPGKDSYREARLLP